MDLTNIQYFLNSGNSEHLLSSECCKPRSRVVIDTEILLTVSPVQDLAWNTTNDKAREDYWKNLNL